ncbi:MAG: response regulator [Bacteroidia bacterium]|nr:response regulator [Bacteroidia bacterium]
MNDTTSIHILLADDDKDDCLFFKDVIEELSFSVSLTIVQDGEQLMQHLVTVSTNLPYALFLDMNMPRKNGLKCLTEIKNHSTLKNLPVIVFSTSYDAEKAIQLYNTGAYYFICKPSDFEELKKVIHQAILLVKQNDEQASKEKFLINKLKTA